MLMNCIQCILNSSTVEDELYADHNNNKAVMKNTALGAGRARKNGNEFLVARVTLVVKIPRSPPALRRTHSTGTLLQTLPTCYKNRPTSDTRAHVWSTRKNRPTSDTRAHVHQQVTLARTVCTRRQDCTKTGTRPRWRSRDRREILRSEVRRQTDSIDASEREQGAIKEA